MKSIYPSDIAEFARQFRFSVCRVKCVRLKNRSRGESTLDVILKVRKASSTLNQKTDGIKLHLVLQGVEEFRFQQRPGSVSRSTSCRFGYFNGLFFIDFDAYSLGAGESAKVHDFRASDSYVACRDIRWGSFEKKKKA
jgi:hypothetical protein